MQTTMRHLIVRLQQSINSQVFYQLKMICSKCFRIFFAGSGKLPRGMHVAAHFRVSQV